MENFDDKYKKKNPFTVPDGYFDNLTERLMKRVGEEERAKKKSVMRFFPPFMGRVAVFVSGLVIVQLLYTVAIDRKLLKSGDLAEQVVYVPESMDEDIFDSHFNPTNDEIIEYLVAETDNYEWMIAGIY